MLSRPGLSVSDTLVTDSNGCFKRAQNARDHRRVLARLARDLSLEVAA